MREIVLDTETTGLEPDEGHRIVEIGAVELFNHVATGRALHLYINPERDMPEEAFAVHGLSSAFLADKPRFAEVAETFLDFVGDARLVIHNARFDIRFLDFELARCGRPMLGMGRALDTLELCRRRFPGAASSLDALCRRFGVDNSSRTKHGALLDSELLAEVYLELVGGRQPDFVLEVASADGTVAVDAEWTPPPRPRRLAPLLTPAEETAHRAFVAELGAASLWAGVPDLAAMAQQTA
jgi:DNA polymerase III subunit epsilon